MSVTKKIITTRLYIISLMLVVIIFSVIYQIIDIQFIKGNELIAKSEKREFKNFEVPAIRGNIYSDDGKLLLSSVSKYNIFFDAVAPKSSDFNKNIHQLADSLANYFEEKPEVWLNNLMKARKKSNRYLSIARNLSYSDYIRFKSFPLFKKGGNKGGFIKEQYTDRVRILRGKVSRTVGYERTDDFGKTTRVGLDGALGEKYLKGENGMQFKQKISGGNWKPVFDNNQREAIDGYDLYTTLNIEIQDAAYHALLKQLEYYEAEYGSVVVMETSTGEIKAISNLGRTSKGTYYEKRNYAVGFTQEPGSTFKLMAMVRALEDKVVDTSDLIDTGYGILKFYGNSVKDSKEGGYGKISVAKAFEVSSNTAMVKIINDNYKEDEKKFVDGLFDMKINEPLGLPIPGEANPKFTHPSDKVNWDRLDLPWMAFGYGIELTPLQTLTFYNAIANNGVMVKPRFIKEVKQFDRVVEKFETDTILESVCSVETAKKVKNMMKNVVEKKHGTANNIYSKEFSMAGKTGTAKPATKLESFYISSFAGYFPAEKPKYSCIVVINKPNKSKGYYGNVVAAPVFKEIAQKIYSSIPKEEVYDYKLIEIKDNNIDQAFISDLERMIMPDISKYELMDIISIMENSGFTIKVEGTGNEVRQVIKPGSKLKKGQKIKIKLI
tara:strand:- start:42804 stop:44795 length:1992 start_codon:yes stop_codon:yes gene_type:complete